MGNDSARPVRVYGLAVAVLDPSGAVLAASRDATLAHYLASGQRVPFSIILPGAPQDGEPRAIYLDARPSPPIPPALTATVTNTYLDECGCFRLAGLVSSSSAQPLLVPLPPV